MSCPKLTKLELQIMEALWTHGLCSIREIQETFPARNRPAYTTVQTTVYRMEAKRKVVRRAKRISNADIFEATISREDAQGTLIDAKTLSLRSTHIECSQRDSQCFSSLGCDPKAGNSTAGLSVIGPNKCALPPI